VAAVAGDDFGLVEYARAGESGVEGGRGVALAEQEAVAGLGAQRTLVEDGEDVDDRQRAADVAAAGGEGRLEHDPAGRVGLVPELGAGAHAAASSIGARGVCQLDSGTASRSARRRSGEGATAPR